MIFYYIRHADPVYNPDSITELGKKQAESLTERLTLYGIDEIYASSSNRAKMTAEPLLKALNKSLSGVFDWANENNLWKTLTVPKSNDVFPVDWAFRTAPYTEKFNSDEIRNMSFNWYDHADFKITSFKLGITQFNERADEFLLSLGYRHDHKRHCFIQEKANDKRIAFLLIKA